MTISCANCGQSFDLSEKRVATCTHARCVCGETLRLQPAKIGEPVRIGKYVLQRRVAVGGMGEVYYGKSGGAEGFARDVAIKKLLPHLASDNNFTEMMVKEAKLTVLLNHPNIVQVYDLFRDREQFYIVMEYVPGVNVGNVLEHCQKNAQLLSLDCAVHIALNVLRGLDYAHEFKAADGSTMSVLHRDVTPQNVLLTQEGWVKITDFGIAKARNEISTTSPGVIKGKLGYIAPEQITGASNDQRVDIFCVGILLWEMLCARRLFKGEDEIDTFRLIAEAVVPSIKKYRSDVSDELEAVVKKSLAKDPTERFFKAVDFYSALLQAIQPRSADDVAFGCKKYLSEHGELFPDTGGGVAENSDNGVVVDPKTLRPISEFVNKPRNIAKMGRWLLPLILLSALGWLTRAPLQKYLTRFTSPAVAPPAPPPKLTNEDVQLAIDGEKLRLQECYQRQSLTNWTAVDLQSTLVIAGTGGVARVTLSEALAAQAKVAECVEAVVRALQFPAQGGSSWTGPVRLPAPPVVEEVQASSPSKALTAAEIQAVLRKRSEAIVRCVQGADASTMPPKVDATVTILGSGKVSEVVLSPTLSEARVEQCIRRNLLTLRFRKHPIKDFKVTIPLQFQVL